MIYRNRNNGTARNELSNYVNYRSEAVDGSGNDNGCRSRYEYRGHGYRGHEDGLGHGGTDK